MEQIVFDECSAEEFIAATHGPREAAAFRACGAPAMQADYLRYCAIHIHGGMYADANFTCRRNLQGLLGRSVQGVFFGRQDPVPEVLSTAYRWQRPVGAFRVVTNGLFGFGEAEHPLPGLAVKAATANIENRVADGFGSVWVTTGPGIFTSIYLLHELGSIEAFLDYTAGSIIERSAHLLCEVVGDYAGIAAMWDGIEIRPLKDRDTWTTKGRERPGGTGWASVRDSIYREDGEGDDLR
jgi:hypothetical protein